MPRVWDLLGCPITALDSLDGPLGLELKAYKFQGLDSPGLLLKEAGAWISGRNFSALVPIPSRRTHNSVENLGQILCEDSGLEYIPALTFARPTLEQKSLLTRPERAENVRGAFHLKCGLLKKGRILLLDDVYASGESATEALSLFLEQGFSNIEMLVFALRDF